MCEAIILAGGFGTRLQEVVKDVPKPMALVNGRPFLSYLLDLLTEYAVERAVLAVGYKHHIIEKHYGQEYRSMMLDYSVETEPLGTGGAIKQALTVVETDQVLIINGDTYFEVDLNDLLEFHQEKDAKVTLALKQLFRYDRYGSVLIDGTSRIRGFTEKGYREEGYINGGVYVINRTYLPELALPDKFSLEHDLLESYYQEARFYGYPSGGYFIDIGIPTDYQKASEHFTSTE